MKLFKAVNSYCKVNVESEVETVRKGVLIVDDSKFSRNILKDILKTEGYLIVGEAGDGLEAIDMARELKPEYIFMDVEMPKLDGLGAIPKILEFDSEVKIIMCTALAQKKIILEAAKSGAKDYVLKPYIKENIIGVLNVIVEKSQKEGQVIPFKSGKKQQDNPNNIVMEENLNRPLAEAEQRASETDYNIEGDFITDKNPNHYIEMEEALQPLEYEDNLLGEGLDSLFDNESLLDNVEEEVLESYLNEDLPDRIQPEGEAEAEDAMVNIEIPVDAETVTEAEAEDTMVNVEIPEDAEAVAEAEAEDAMVNIEIPEDAETVAEAEAEDTMVNIEIPEDAETVAEAESEDAMVNVEIPEEAETIAEAEAEDTMVNVEIPEDAEAVAEAEAEEDMVNVEIPKDDEAEERAKFVIAVLNEEATENGTTVTEIEPEKAIVKEEASEDDTTVSEAEPEKAIVKEEASEDDTTVSEAEPEKAIVNEETFENDAVVVVAEPEDAMVNEVSSELDAVVAELEPEEAQYKKAEPGKTIVSKGVPDYFYSLEKTNPDNTSDSISYTYLWNNRFDTLQNEFNIHNTASQRVSFHEYAYLDSNKNDTFGNDYSKREMALGMMNAYMSLDSRLQQNDSSTLRLRALTYTKGIRFFTSNILEESNDRYSEITILDEIKYNSLKPKQTSQERMIKTGFYQVISDFVYAKSGRVLR